MAGKPPRNSFRIQLGGWLSDFAVTMTCWAYFTLGFVLLFSVGYCVAYLFSPQREISFQRLTNLFFRGFLGIVRTAAPRHHWQIDKRIAETKSSVIICNHLSYLDPLLMISLFKRQKTIVKTKFFKVPILGWVIRNAGYCPADSNGKFARMMIDQIEQMEGYLAGGGNLFVFPEGTRSRDGKIAPLNRGALKIARLCRAPVYVLHLCNTEKLFTPGKFLFNTRIKNTISLTIVDRIEPDSGQGLSLTELESRISQALMMLPAESEGRTI
ncbi:2-acyl-glycerophospho-ethanolamine acyltransferase [bacterium BMS3Bbin14]|nr:2-acyl-glycerophospho-ethanolamine acyltransferase [bacterium BMS3Abin13]GBE53710.1 2-acyl-glycerophospho-ethanolamine acyltransferase [bacterium BMS3Bbin14]HDK43054.1 1-acyl-sn-glycerol-3-phosphate acyltransferase [Desulfobacteraceae bacterium]